MKEKKRKNIKKKSFTTRTAGNVCLCHNGFFFKDLLRILTNWSCTCFQFIKLCVCSC